MNPFSVKQSPHHDKIQTTITGTPDDVVTWCGYERAAHPTATVVDTTIKPGRLQVVMAYEREGRGKR